MVTARARRTRVHEPDLDEILYMRDIVRITGKHRCTIHRWIAEGRFPRKSIPRGSPIGWSPAEIDHWKHGGAPGQSKVSAQQQGARASRR